MSFTAEACRVDLQLYLSHVTEATEASHCAIHHPLKRKHFALNLSADGLSGTHHKDCLSLGFSLLLSLSLSLLPDNLCILEWRVLPSAGNRWRRPPQRSNQPDQSSITIFGLWGWPQRNNQPWIIVARWEVSIGNKKIAVYYRIKHCIVISDGLVDLKNKQQQHEFRLRRIRSELIFLDIWIVWKLHVRDPFLGSDTLWHCECNQSASSGCHLC